MDIKLLAQQAFAIRDTTARRFLRHDPELLKRLGPQFITSDCARVGQALKESKILLWQSGIFNIATKGADEFTGTALAEPMVEGGPEFWIYNGFYQNAIPETLNLPATAKYCYGLLLLPHRDGLTVLWFFEDRSESTSQPHPPTIRGQAVALNSKIPKPLARVIACRQFLSLRLAAQEPVRLPRPDRKRLEREQRQLPDIRVIELRAREGSGWHSNGNREYHHRWINKGHWRKLPEPLLKDSPISGGRKGEQVVWVRECVKGPANAPLLEPRESVYVVAR